LFTQSIKQFNKVCNQLKAFNDRLKEQYPNASIIIKDGKICLLENKEGDSVIIAESNEYPKE